MTDNTQPLDAAGAAVEWLRNNYQDHPNIASLCEAMRVALNNSTEKSDGWLPIESAPVETELLGWREDCGVLLILHTSFDRFATDQECEETEEATLFQKDWFGACIPGGFERLEDSERPTHWVPLPTAPTQGVQHGE